MKTLTALLTLAGVAGIGYYVYKKMNEKKEDTTAYTEYKEKRTAGDRVRRASMYAVGTIKTTADKISEGIRQVKSEDMVKKGEETVEQIKDTTNGIKDEIKEIKNLVTSINISPADTTIESDVADEPESEVESDDDMSSSEDDVMDLFDTTEPAEQL